MIREIRRFLDFLSDLIILFVFGSRGVEFLDAWDEDPLASPY